MNYANYNDYELIYLIRDGSELALNVFYNKYLSYIWKTALRYYKNSDKVNDLVSTGLMTLFKSLEKYDMDYGASFYVFFEVCLNRAILKELKSSYYTKVSYLCDNEVCYNPGLEEKYRISSYAKSVCKDEIDYALYEDCILNTMSLRAFAENHGITFQHARYKKECMIRELKKILTI